MLISVDPGFISGTCIADRVDASGRFSVTACIAIEWKRRFYYYDTILANASAIEAIIIEDFKLTGDPKKLKTQYLSRMPSSQVIAILETAAYAAGIFDRIKYQEPKDRFQVKVLPHDQRFFSSDDPYADHMRDAYRHLHYYMRVTKFNL